MSIKLVRVIRNGVADEYSDIIEYTGSSGCINYYDVKDLDRIKPRGPLRFDTNYFHYPIWMNKTLMYLYTNESMLKNKDMSDNR